MSSIKGKLAKRAVAGGKRGKKAASDDKKKKDEPKKPKQKVCTFGASFGAWTQPRT